jgi:4-aminobutyrate aminotransferase-like enzyme
VACAAGQAVLDTVQQEQLQQNALHRGNELLAGLKELVQRHEIAGDARGKGLFLGLELVRNRETLTPAAEEASYVVNRMREQQILMGTDGPHHNVLKIRPSMIVESADVDRVLSRLDRTLAELKC